MIGTIGNLVIVAVAEYEYCSNRGTCDFSTGNCLCASGYGGSACDTVHTTYLEGTNAHVYQEVGILMHEIMCCVC